MATTGTRLGCALAATGAVVVLGLLIVSIGRSVVSTGPAASSSAAGSGETTTVAGSGVQIARSAPADVVALLDGLRPGARIGDFTVFRIRTEPEQHRIEIELAGEKVGFSIWIEKKSATPAPRQTGNYSIFFGRPWEQGEAKLPADAQGPVLDDISARLKKTEGSVPVPKGM